MIVEGVVLLRVEHLQQRAGGVAAEVGGHLVHLVEQEDRVGAAAALHVLDDLARHRPDVRPPVAADLGLVAHAAQRDAHEGAPRGPGDAAAQRGLAHPGGAHEAEDRALVLLHQGLHRQVLDDALLDLLQAVVVLLQHLLGPLQVAVVVGVHLPGQVQHPVDVVAHHRGLGRHGGHHLEPPQLAVQLLLGLLAQRLGRDLVLQLGDLALKLVALAQLLLDRVHLLVEVVLLLRLLHLTLDARADALLNLQDLDLALHQLVELVHPRSGVGQPQQLLLVLQLELQVRADGVRQARGLVDGLHRDQHLGRDALVELDVGLEGRLERAHQGLALHRGLALLLRHGRDLHQEELLLLEVALDAHALLALHQHLDRAVGQAQQLDDRAQGPHLEDVLALGVVGLGLLLRHQQDVLVGVHGLLEGADGAIAPHEERHHHVRKDDDVPQREDRDVVCLVDDLRCGLGLGGLGLGDLGLGGLGFGLSGTRCRSL